MSFEIEKIAELARLSLKADEKAKLAGELEAILGYVKSLEKVDTSSVEPTSHVLNLENVFRPDQVKNTDARDKVLKYAPLADGKFFKVPKVVDRE